MQFKAQSAMEYLMTYGWAILIIAVVLAALFQLGVFNPNTFAPKAPPGSCQVIRPYGVGTTNYINLAGTCNNQLPQYVAKQSAKSGCAVGTQYIRAQNLNLNLPEYTITIWTDQHSQNAVGTLVHIYSYSASCPSWQGTFLYASSGFLHPSFYASGGCVGSAVAVPNTNGWYFTAFAMSSSGNIVGYFNSNQVYTNALTGNVAISPSEIDIGDYLSGCEDTAPGSMANVQIYNTSLSQNDITALYNEGIGGAPIDLQHLVAWWPLNGNANDYSGNNYNAEASGIEFSGSWATTYSAP